MPDSHSVVLRLGSQMEEKSTQAQGGQGQSRGETEGTNHGIHLAQAPETKEKIQNARH